MKLTIGLFAAIACAGLVMAQTPTPTQEKPTLKGPWADAKVGAAVKFRTTAGTSEVTMIMEVIKADEQTVTIRKTMSVESDKPEEKVESRLFTKDEIEKRLEKIGKRQDDETIKVMGKDIKCEVYVMEVADAAKPFKIKRYLNREIPNWIVRMDTDKSGKMTTVMELTEVKN